MNSNDKISVLLDKKVWALVVNSAKKDGKSPEEYAEVVLRKTLEADEVICSFCENPILSGSPIKCARCGQITCCGYIEISPPLYSNEYHCYTCIDLPLKDDTELEEEYDLEDLEGEVLNDLSRNNDYEIDLIQRIPPKKRK